jgi:hypothetical protein
LNSKKDTLKTVIENELSGDKALQNAAYITQFLRAPGSKGLHRVLDFIEEKLSQYNLDKLYKIDYPSKENNTEEITFKGWDVNDAKLEIVEPFYKEITSFDQAPTCIQWWSSSTPPGGVTAELVDVGTGVDEKCYNRIDVKGKIILATGDNQAEGNTRAFQLAVEKHGALGLITDNLPYAQLPLRTRVNHPEAISFLRIRTKSDMGWAFALSLSMGEYIRELMKNGPVKIRATVDAKYVDEKDWEIVGEITGNENPNEEVWFVLHCSGPKPGANCASGAALGLEIARTMKTLIDKGIISRPKRTIKFLIGAEGDGLNAYLQTKIDENIDVKAAFVFCSVGDDQCKCSSSLLMYRSPDSIPSYVNDICADAVETFSNDAFTPYSAERPNVPLIRFSVRPYTPMSDNSRLMTMKIPCPLFWSWPSRHFHTNFYTVDKLDPNVIKKSGMVAAYSALKIADAGRNEALQFAQIIRSKTLSRMQEITNTGINAILEAGEYKNAGTTLSYIDKLNYTLERDIISLETVNNLLNKTDKEFEEEILKIIEMLREASKYEIGTIQSYKKILESK